MIKIGITGSIASGKSTVAKILSNKRGPLFNADKEVIKLYKSNNFKKILIRQFNLDTKSNLKKSLKEKIFENKINFKKLEKLIHPIIRKKMKKFSHFYRRKKILFFEIHLLIESKLMKYFDVIIFVKAKKKIRLKRFITKGGNKKLFRILNSKQLPDKKKIQHCDHIVVNENNFNILKKKLLSIINFYV